MADAVASDLARLWPDLIVFALAGSELARAARLRGLRVAEEVFADRTYRPDGSLTPRAEPDALINDEERAVAQALRLVRDGVVRATDGREVKLKADTICLHGDGPHAVAFAQRLNAEFVKAGIVIKPARV